MKLALKNDKRITTFFFLLFLFCKVPATFSQKSPNIILILVDDQGWSHTSLQMDKNNPESKSDYIQTPFIVELGKNGMRFSKAYAASPVCAPSRYAIQTGKTPAQLHYTSIIGSYEEDIDNKQISIAQLLKKANPKYKTAHFGKWHMKFNPNDFGYDESDGKTTNATGSYYIKDNSKKWEGLVKDDPKKIFEITESANVFMEKQAKNNHPFFLQISHYANHDHLMAREETLKKFQALSKGKVHNNAMYAAMSYDLDEGIGLVLKKIKELGIEDNTYIIYTSDNGGVPQLPPSRNQYAQSLNYPLQRGKWDLTEGGIRVPLLISGPGIEKNSQSDEAVVGYDFLPTILELAKAKIKIPNDVDGSSILPALFNKGKVKRKENGIIFHYPHYNHFGIGEPHSVIIKESYKLIKLRASGKTYLYNLKTDVEKKDIKKNHPKLAEKMETNLENYLQSVVAEKMESSKNWFRGNGEFSKKFPFDESQLNSKKEKKQKAIGIIDLSITTGKTTQNSSGFSMGIQEKEPHDSIIIALKPKLFRGQLTAVDGNSGIRILKRMKNLRLDIQFTVSNEYLVALEKKKEIQSNFNKLPKDANEWQLWQKTIHESYQKLKLENLDIDMYWDFWEKPDELPTKNQFFEFYKKSYNYLKKLDKNAKVVAPSLSKFDYSFLREFLLFAKENNCLPSYLSWNENVENNFPQQIPIHANKLRPFMRQHKIPEIPIQINEYVSPKRNTSVAQQLFYITNLEKAKISKAAKTNSYTNNLTEKSKKADLNGLLTESSLLPKATFWLNYFYAQMNGDLVRIDNNPTEPILFDGIANVDHKNRKIKLLLGRTGNLFGRKIELKLTHFSSIDWLKNKKNVIVTLTNIKNSSTANAPKPKISFQRVIDIHNDSIEFDLLDFKKQEGIYIEIE